MKKILKKFIPLEKTAEGKALTKKSIALLTAFCLMLGILGGLSQYFSPSIRVGEEKFNLSNVNKQKRAKDISVGLKTTLAEPSISAGGAILIDQKTGEVIYEKNADKKLYPASTTKIMTALITLETLDEIGADIFSKVKVPDGAVGVEGSSIYLKKGEELTIEELLYGLMLRSGNDSAVAIATIIGGKGGESEGVENFVNKMNERAKELGLQNTNFVNPSGLFDENHYTTARDLAKIAQTAMDREDFRKIVGAKSWHSELSERTFANKNKTIYQYDGATGIKIGFTKKSGRTLVASAKRGETELIAVVLSDGNWFNDAYSMLDYGFSKTLAK